MIATKVGARPLAPGTSFTDNAEGLSARVVRESSQRWWLDESLAGVDLKLTTEQRTRLDTAR